MAKYHVAAISSELVPTILFTPEICTYEVELDPPINAERIYDAINKDRKYKTGQILSWSKIE